MGLESPLILYLKKCTNHVIVTLRVVSISKESTTITADFVDWTNYMDHYEARMARKCSYSEKGHNMLLSTLKMKWRQKFTPSALYFGKEQCPSFICPPRK